MSAAHLICVGLVTFSACIILFRSFEFPGFRPVRYGVERSGAASWLKITMRCFAILMCLKWPSHMVWNSESITVNGSR